MNDPLKRLQEDGRSLRVYRDRPPSLYSVLARAAKEHADESAIISEHETISYRQLLTRVDAAAEHLVHTFSLRKGDRIGLLFPNSIPFCELLLAAAKTGVIAVLLNAKLTAHELGYMIGHAGCTMLFYDAVCEEKARQLQAMYPKLRCIRSGDTGDTGGDTHANEPSYEAISRLRLPPTLADAAAEDDPCYMMYTSGTTGVPKGALTLHRNMIHSAINYCRVCGTTSSDTTIIAVPLFHVTGLVGQFIHMLMVGGTSVLVRDFSTDSFVETSIAHDVTFMFNVPAIYNMLLTREQSKHINKLRLALYGGAPMTAETISRLRERFPGLTLQNAYGATETSSPATIMPANWPADKIASVGKPVPGADIRIMDERGRQVPAGEVGELWISGPMVIPAYWDNEGANAASFENGFWKSGDLAKIDEDGYVYIMDRKKDLINRGGEKIYCIEIESVLSAHPQIAEAAVVGVPDAIFGEQIKACIVPKAGQQLEIEQVKAYAGQFLAPFKVPRYVQLLTSIPRNPGGKIMKHLLRGEPERVTNTIEQPENERSDAQ